MRDLLRARLAATPGATALLARGPGLCPGGGLLGVCRETGNRKNKVMARLKFVLGAKGIEEFRRLVAEKRKASQAPAGLFTVPSPIQPSLVTIASAPLTSAAETQTDAEYDRWAEHNLMFQRQPGYGSVWVKLPAGTCYSTQMRGLAGML